MITEEKIRENQEFLDTVAIETMKAYVSRQPPKSFDDSMSIARVCYRQALAMLDVREKSLIKLAEDIRMIRKTKKQD